MNTARGRVSGTGATNTAALAIGGYPAPLTALVETWNGTNWTAVNNLGTARYSGAASGTNTAALMIGGTIAGSGITAVTELWNGTNWTEVNDLNTARKYLAGCWDSNSCYSFW